MRKSQHILSTAAILLILILAAGVLSGQISAQEELFDEIDEHGNLRLGNEYIVIVVNQEENARSRFAVETTGGDPGTAADEEQPLIYGRPIPWTSYTTIQIDGENYVFGGETDRRAGAGANYGEELQAPTIEDDSIVARYQIEEFEVEQRLELIQSTTTGLYDTARIEYRLTNTGDEPADLGLRIMLDTMLGENDGSPFRLEDDAITVDTRYEREELPDFYQSFDSLTDPHVTSQGSFISPDVDTPDRAKMSNWGSLADGVWDFNFNPGEEFIREGEFEIDSAIALYWDPQQIQPGETVTYATSYGLGGITMVPGLLSLGVSSPTEFAFSPENPEFPVVAYIENTTDIDAEEVTARIELPEELSTEEVERELGDLEAGEVTQISWYVGSQVENLPETLTFKVVVDAENTDSNEVERSLDVIGPAELVAEIYLPDIFGLTHGVLEPLPYRLRARIENIGESPFRDFTGEIILPPGIDFASYEKPVKQAGIIQPQEEIVIDWQVMPQNVEGVFPFALQIQGRDGYSRTIRENIEIPATRPTLYLEASQSAENSSYLTLKIKGNNLTEIESIDFDLLYNEDNLDLIYATQGTAFVRDGRLMAWNGPENEENALIFSENLPDDIDSGGFAKMVFRIKEEDYLAGIELDNITARDQNGEEVEISLENLVEEEDI